MLTVFRNARLIDPESTAEKSGHLVVRDGQIDALVEDQEAPSPEGAEIVECNGKCLAPGIVDIGVKIGEPGERHKESFRSAGLAAAAGGVTTMVTRADTVPTIDSPEVLEFALRRGAEASPVRIAAMAALTRAREGREMVEIGFLQDAGAVAFSDGDRVTRDTKVLSRCLTYARSLGALVIGHPQEPGLSAGAISSGASLRGETAGSAVPTSSSAASMSIAHFARALGPEEVWGRIERWSTRSASSSSSPSSRARSRPPSRAPSARSAARSCSGRSSTSTTSP